MFLLRTLCVENVFNEEMRRLVVFTGIRTLQNVSLRAGSQRRLTLPKVRTTQLSLSSVDFF